MYEAEQAVSLLLKAPPSYPGLFPFIGSHIKQKQNSSVKGRQNEEKKDGATAERGDGEKSLVYLRQ